MNTKELLLNLTRFTEKLQDEESRRLYDIRFDYFLNRDIDDLESRICKEALKYKDSAYCPALNRYFNRYPNNKNKKAILFGAGFSGRSALRSLQVLGIDVQHVVDNNYELIKEIEGIRVESPNIISNHFNDGAFVIVSIMDYSKKLEVYYQLISLGIIEENILLLKDGLWCDYGLQYFDLPYIPINSEGEIFVDAGCFNGMSSYNAMTWSDNKINKIYAFEPDKNNFPACEKRIRDLGCDYELINAATWSEKTELIFEENSFGQASKVNLHGNVRVQADSIDNILNNRPATFIKLDVEGSELETLQGAVKTIKRYRPKLAISLYHKPEDVVTLPLFIESLNMDYKYYIRHYQTRWCETILYAL